MPQQTPVQSGFMAFVLISEDMLANIDRQEPNQIFYAWLLIVDI